MPSDLRRNQCCVAVVEGARCLRPARELGHLCGQCWRGLTAAQRDVLRREAEAEDTDEIDTAAIRSSIAECEAIAALATVDPEGLN